MKQISDSRIKQIFSALMIIALFVIQACGEKPEETGTTDKTTYIDTISVEAQTVEVKELALSKTFSGTLEGEEQANIIAKIPETITKIRVKVGDYVKTGSVLFELNKSGASSQFFQAQAAYLNAEKNFERMQNLLKEGAISQQAFDLVETGYEVAKANFDAARSTVEITSPLSGVVTAINVNLGDLTNPTIPMATVANIGRMKAIINVGESDVPNFFVGQQTKIYSVMNPDLIQTGKITQLSKSANIQSRTFEIQSTFSNTQDRWFKPGMFCRVAVDMKSKKDALTIPLSAVVKSGEADGVYIINDSKSYLKTITLGLSDGKNVEVISGLKSGDKIVTLGMNNLKDGTVVVVTKN